MMAAVLQIVTDDQVRRARMIMRSGVYGLGSAASELKVPMGALDLALWRNLGRRL